MRILPVLALGATLMTGGCYDAYGRVDPGRTALLGAGVGAAAGLGVAAASQPRYYAPAPTYYAPPPTYYAPPPRYYYGRPRYYYGY
ncbi:MAG TPA: hypothetical protein VD970_13445 [Acetobacteraceae bacterium]|nr:hypothetical protein [Acetobacteraceae bacterium]